MRIVLSRKGFDSGAGGVPSPIMPDGSMCSLPIPIEEDEPPRLADIVFQGRPLSRIVADLTRGRYGADTSVHLDPDLRHDAVHREKEWLPLFGQRGGPQMHLVKHGVCPGDLFLFLGWFRRTVSLNGRLTYERGQPDLHVIFGWLQIEQVIDLKAESDCVPSWAQSHPHMLQRKRWESKNNTLYVSSKWLRLPGIVAEIPGAGAFERFRPELCLTAARRSRSIWRLPSWFYPGARKPLSQHGNPKRWEQDAEGVLLQSVPRGQEFVLDCEQYPEAVDWVRSLLTPARV